MTARRKLKITSIGHLFPILETFYHTKFVWISVYHEDLGVIQKLLNSVLASFPNSSEGEPMEIVVVIIILVILGLAMGTNKPSNMPPDELKDYDDRLRWGPVSPAYICPHCQTKGFVRTMPVKRKRGISGAKATAGLLTTGLSVLATGLSRKEGLTQAHCGNCNSTWDF